MKYNELCEMDVGDLMNALMGQSTDTTNGSCAVEKPIQPDDNVGEFGNSQTIQIIATEDGGLEVDSKELAIKLSKDVFEAIKSYINKGD